MTLFSGFMPIDTQETTTVVVFGGSLNRMMVKISQALAHHLADQITMNGTLYGRGFFGRAGRESLAVYCCVESPPEVFERDADRVREFVQRIANGWSVEIAMIAAAETEVSINRLEIWHAEQGFNRVVASIAGRNVAARLARHGQRKNSSASESPISE